jgi:CheY-like chemotaxis protein
MSRLQAKMRVRFAQQDAHYRTQLREPVILIVEDKPVWSEAVSELCAFLEVHVERVATDADLKLLLRERRPMAVLTTMEGQDQDGCHVLKRVGQHDPELAVMILTGDDPVLIGAAEAVRQVWGLTRASIVSDIPTPGEIMEFLFSAGQSGRCLGLMPV